MRFEYSKRCIIAIPYKTFKEKTRIVKEFRKCKIEDLNGTLYIEKFSD